MGLKDFISRSGIGSTISALTTVGGMPADLKASGVEATAVVQQMSVIGSGSGTTVNGTPVVDFTLLVTLPGFAPYAAKVRQLLPYLLVGSVLPDSMLFVRVDPNNSGRVAVDFSQMLPANGSPAMVQGTPQSGDEVRATGTSGVGLIQQTFSVGSITAPNGDPVLGIIMNVSYPGHPAFLSKNGQRVPRDKLSLVVPGATFPVKGDPAKHDFVVIDWS
jgi:hypothetical protein